MRIAVDGVFFQMISSGIGRVWLSLLQAWARSGFSRQLVVLDRAGSAPKLPGIRYVTIPAHNYATLEQDRTGLQKVCDNLHADVFVSTYYSTPLTTPALLLVHDMIPEVMGWSLDEPMWREKRQALDYASAYVCVSENTARDLKRLFPPAASRPVTLALNGVDRNAFHPAGESETHALREKHRIANPYFMLVGQRERHKNAQLSFRGFAHLAGREAFDIVCAGGYAQLEPELAARVPGTAVHMLRLGDDELRAAYSGARALVYPSTYEGFGLPIIEAMACACPVISCAKGAIPEVAGDAALYVGEDDAEAMAAALTRVLEPETRAALGTRGLARAQAFSWERMAAIMGQAITNVAKAERRTIPHG